MAIRRLTGLICTALVASTLLKSALASAKTEFESPVEAVALVELFTSEGCNSCPPADAWFSSLAESEHLWSRYVPVAFHVTYWDSLGWRDRFAQKTFDARHATTALRAGSPVYTPGVFVAGKEWRQWRRAPRMLDEIPNGTVGVLKLELDAATAVATFDSVREVIRPRVALAWLQSNQSTRVARGENAGKTLRHQFVVRRVDSLDLKRVDAVWRAAFPVVAADLSGNQAVAVWVVDEDDVPVQATGGWLSDAPVSSRAAAATD